MKTEEAAVQFARAVVQDVRDNPKLDAAIGHLATHMPPGQAGLLISALKRDLIRELKDDFSVVLFPKTRNLFRIAVSQEGQIRSGMEGFLSTFMTTALPAIASAATSIYTTKVQVKAQEDIAKMQQQAQVAEAEAAKAQAEARQKEAEAAMQAAMKKTPEQVVQAAIESQAAPAGFPTWIVPVGLGVGALALFLIFGRKR